MSNDNYPPEEEELQGPVPEPENPLGGPVADGDLAVGRGEGVGQAQEVQGLTQGQIVFARFVRHRGAMAGLIILVLIALLAITSMGIGPIRGWW